MKQFLIILLASFMLVSCHRITGSGNIITEKRNPGRFSGVSTSSGIDVELKIGEQMEVTVESDDNIIKYVETKIRDGVLRIRFEDGLSLTSTHVKVYVTAPAIKSLKASSAGSIMVNDVIQSDEKISIQASSSGNIIVEVEAPEVKASASSGADIAITGKTRDYKADASSGATIKSGNLLSERTTVTASSGATANVHASVSLDARASSGASIRYRGGGNAQKRESSGGSVTKIE